MSESVNEVDGVRGGVRGALLLEGVEVKEVKEVQEDGKEQRGRYGKVEKGGKKASCRGGGEGKKSIMTPL